MRFKDLFASGGRVTVLMAFAAMIWGCAETTPTPYTERPEDADKILVLEAPFGHTSQLQYAFAEEGFQVIASSKETPSAEEVRYGIRFSLDDEIDWCKGKEARKFNVAYMEVYDRLSGQTLLTYRTSGWTERCIMPGKTVFDKSAVALRRGWSENDGWWQKLKAWTNRLRS